MLRTGITVIAAAALLAGTNSAWATLTLNPLNAASTIPGNSGTLIYYFPMVGQTVPANCAAGTPGNCNSCSPALAGVSTLPQQPTVSVNGGPVIQPINPFTIVTPPPAGGPQDVNPDPTLQPYTLQFSLAESSIETVVSAAPAGATVVIRVEPVTTVTPAVAALPIVTFNPGSNGYFIGDSAPPLSELTYGTTDNAAVTFGVALRDFQSSDGANPVNAIPGSTTFPVPGLCSIFASNGLGPNKDGPSFCSPPGGFQAVPITLRIGVMWTNTTPGNTLTTASNADSTTVQVVMADCPAGASVATVFPNPHTNAFAQITPLLSATAGDQQINVTNTTPAFTSSDAVQVVGFQLVADTPPSPITVSSPIQRPIGNVNQGTFNVGGLSNNTPLCFSLGFVNAAGFVTTDQNWSNAYPILSSPACATPSQIDGFLNRSTCFIATAAYGREWDPRLEILRQFRDQILERVKVGQEIVDWYYGWSPQAAQWLLSNPGYKAIVRVLLLPVVEGARVSLWIRANMWVFGIALLLGTVAAALGMRRRASS